MILDDYFEGEFYVFLKIKKILLVGNNKKKHLTLLFVIDKITKNPNIFLVIKLCRHICLNEGSFMRK